MVVRYVLADGERRWRAAQLVRMKELSAVVLDHKPTTVELLLIQASIDLHRKDFRPMERSNLLARVMKETGCSVAEVGAKVGLSQATSSRSLAFLKLGPTLQQKLDAGELDLERAYFLSQEPDHAKQLELLKGVAGLSRDQLRQKAKSAGKSQVKVATARFPLQLGVSVTVQGQEMTIDGCIEALQEVVKELKRGQSQGIEIDAMQRVLKDKAKAGR